MSQKGWHQILNTSGPKDQEICLHLLRILGGGRRGGSTESPLVPGGMIPKLIHFQFTGGISWGPFLRFSAIFGKIGSIAKLFYHRHSRKKAIFS